MEQARFEDMVNRLERESEASPTAYRMKVALLALLGFALILLILGFAGAALLLLSGMVVGMLATGGKLILLLLKLGKLLLLLAIPCWMLIRSSFSAMFVRIPRPEGVELKRRDAPALFAEMDRMRGLMKGPCFHHVIIDDRVNAAVVQRPLLGLFGFHRNYLILGLPLLESLSPREMLAVVAHEYGHLAGQHHRFGAFIYRLRNTWATMQQISEQWSGWIGRRLHGVVSWYAPYFNAYTFVLARADEYQADAASARLVGADAARAALKRVSLAACHHEWFMDAALEKVRDEPAPPSNLTAQWAVIAARAASDAQASRWLDQALQRKPHYADTHPALEQRLHALSSDGDWEGLPAPLNGPTAAREWLGDGVTGLREHFQRSWQARIGEHWQAQHEEIQQRIARLAALRATTAPELEEQIELLQLQCDLEPQGDNLAALAAFNAAHPDIPVTLYREADLRLDAGDATGLELLERVMTLDADAIKPACNLAWQFLHERDEARAERYAERWRERDVWETERYMQAEHLDVKHELVDADLDSGSMAQVRALLEAHRGKGIAQAWLARRVIPADAEVRTFVLGLKLRWWARLLGRQQHVVGVLSKGEWPMHLFICVLEDANKPLLKKFKALPATRLL